MRLLSIAEICERHIGTFPMISIFLSKRDRQDPRESWEKRCGFQIGKIVGGLSAKPGKRESRDIETEIKSLLTLVDWTPRVGSVGIFHGPDLRGYVKLPICVDDFHTVSDRFQLGPIYQWLTLKERYYLLTLNPSEAILFRGSALGLEQLEVIAAARPNKSDKKLIETFVEKLNIASLKHLHGETAPLVLSGLESHQAMFRSIAGYPYVEPQGLPVASQNLRWLHKESLAVVNRLVCHAEDSSLRELILAFQDKNATFEIGKIAVAAVAGRIECLFIAEDQRISGTVDRNSGEIHSPQNKRASQDLLKQLAEITAEHRGRVVCVSAAKLPTTSFAAATLRW